MKPFWNHLYPKPVAYQRYEVIFMRLLFGLLLWYNLPVLDKFDAQPKPNGFAQLFGIDFTWAGDPQVMGILKMVLLPVLAAYVMGFVSFLTLPYMFVLSLAVGTLKNSQGAISHVYQVITFILMAQCAWALYYHVRKWIGKPHHFYHGQTTLGMEVYVSQAAVAAIYLTTGITKLIRSEGTWLWQIRKIGVDLEKTWSQDYYNELATNAPGWAIWLRDLVTEKPMMAVLLFAPGLLAELFAFLGIYGRKLALLMGVLLVILHVGAIYVMRLEFQQNIAVLVIFFVNVPFWTHVLLKRNAKVSQMRARKVK